MKLFVLSEMCTHRVFFESYGPRENACELFGKLTLAYDVAGICEKRRETKGSGRNRHFAKSLALKHARVH